jgi:hypothetical protein
MGPRLRGLALQHAGRSSFVFSIFLFDFGLGLVCVCVGGWCLLLLLLLFWLFCFRAGPRAQAQEEAAVPRARAAYNYLHVQYSTVQLSFHGTKQPHPGPRGPAAYGQATD